MKLARRLLLRTAVARAWNMPNGAFASHPSASAAETASIAIAHVTKWHMGQFVAQRPYLHSPTDQLGWNSLGSGTPPVFSDSDDSSAEDSGVLGGGWPSNWVYSNTRSSTPEERATFGLWGQGEPASVAW